MVSTEVTLHAFFSFCFTLPGMMKKKNKKNWSQLKFVNISYQIIMRQTRSYQFVGVGGLCCCLVFFVCFCFFGVFFVVFCLFGFFFLNDVWDISWTSFAEGIKIKSTSFMSVTPVFPFIIPIQKCLHIATICPNWIIFCKIVPSSKAAIFCFKL